MKKLVLLGRVSLFVIFFWFGILKVIGISPAEPLVHNLFDQLFPEIISFEIFNRIFGAFECFIGIIWLVPGLTRFSLYILLFHIVLTFLPELFLPEDTWQMWLTPTLIGQYIIKNLALISLGLLIYKQTEEEKLAFVRIP